MTVELQKMGVLSLTHDNCSGSLHTFDDCKKCIESTVRIRTDGKPVKFTLNVFAVCKYIDCTQYSFLLCYLCHCHLAVHRAADGCVQLMAVMNLKCSQTKRLSEFLSLVVQTLDQSR